MVRSFRTSRFSLFSYLFLVLAVGSVVSWQDVTTEVAALAANTYGPNTWGNGEQGELGDGNFYSGSPYGSAMPLAVNASSDVVAVSGGNVHSIALKSDGTVLAWGNNEFGQLGDGTRNNSAMPVQVKGVGGSGVLGGVTAVVAGRDHNLALLSDGTVVAWGFGEYGQLGDGTFYTANPYGSLTPVQVKGIGGSGVLMNVVAISAQAGSNHSLALKSDGTVVAWGIGNNGQLGDGNFYQSGNLGSATPVQVAGVGGSGMLSGIAAISAGGNHSLALKSDGTVVSWGSNFYGGLGSGDFNDSATPVQVKGVGGTGALSHVVAISGGGYHSVALKSGSTVVAWGKGGNGQLGNGNNIDSSTPAQVNDVGGSGSLSAITAINAGGNHSLALKADGRIIAWGAGTYGQLGDGNFYNNAPLAPVQVTALMGETVTGAGYYHSLSARPQITVSNTGTNIFVQGGVANITFSDLTTVGTLSFTRINPQSQGLLPNYSFNTIYPAFDISGTGIAYSGNIHVCLVAPNVIDSATFSSLRLLHNDGSGLTDVTSDTNFGNRQVCGNVSSLSPFVIASTGSPTAAPASITGRVVDTEGRPVSGATMTVVGGPGLIRAITDTNGFYKVENLETSGFYTVTPSRANYVFGPTQRSFSLLGNRADATFTAMPVGPVANPLDSPEFFVRQQYVDFLGREPDQGGLDYWSGQLRACGTDLSCLNARRIGVSAAFFVEQEFQDTGSFIYGLYEGALGRQPAYAEYAADRLRVISGANLEADKNAFAESFVARVEFAQRYPNSMTTDSFVDELLRNVQQTSGVDLSDQRAVLINLYNSGRNTAQSRSAVMRRVIEANAFKQAEYNPAFVFVEYFGYLRRDADQSGYNFWLNVLNNREPGNYRGMVCAFITSAEYQNRFSSVMTHTNAECSR
jgi:alpha-tubulin suppressor-like RCC1 family protein